MTRQPKWRCVAQIGDPDPMLYGGKWIFVDTTGVYAPEMEIFEGIEDRDNPDECMIFRFSLEPCYYTDGVLSDNQFHLHHQAWFAKYLEDVAEFSNRTVETLIKCLCPKVRRTRESPLEDGLKVRAHVYTLEELISLAWAYGELADYHGYFNFDSYPLVMSEKEVRRRYKQKKYEVKPHKEEAE